MLSIKEIQAYTVYGCYLLGKENKKESADLLVKMTNQLIGNYPKPLDKVMKIDLNMNDSMLYTSIERDLNMLTDTIERIGVFKSKIREFNNNVNNMFKLFFGNDFNIDDDNFKYVYRFSNRIEDSTESDLFPDDIFLYDNELWKLKTSYSPESYWVYANKQLKNGNFSVQKTEIRFPHNNKETLKLKERGELYKSALFVKENLNILFPDA